MSIQVYQLGTRIKKISKKKYLQRLEKRKGSAAGNPSPEQAETAEQSSPDTGYVFPDVMNGFSPSSVESEESFDTESFDTESFDTETGEETLSSGENSNDGGYDPSDYEDPKSGESEDLSESYADPDNDKEYDYAEEDYGSESEEFSGRDAAEDYPGAELSGEEHFDMPGKSFEYISPEAENPKKKKNKKKNYIRAKGAVFLCGTEDARETLRLAKMQYHGEIDVSGVEFCKVEVQRKCMAGSLRIPRLSRVLDPKIRMQFFVNKKNIVIISDDGFAELIIDRVRRKRSDQGSTKELFLYNFLQQILTRDLIVLSRYERRIMQLEDAVMDDNFEEFQEMIRPIRRELLTLREYYDELKDLGDEFEDNENHFLRKDYLPYFGTIKDRADRLNNRTDHLIAYLGQVREVYREKIAEEQNDNMQYLTVVSTIFMPLTLITGWFGMNFKNMPELDRGYPLVIIFSVLVLVIIVLFFKKKKFL